MRAYCHYCHRGALCYFECYESLLCHTLDIKSTYYVCDLHAEQVAFRSDLVWFDEDFDYALLRRYKRLV